jgi:Na+/proline symporter
MASALYFGALLAVAWWVVKKGKDEAADYFLAGRNLRLTASGSVRSW